MSNKEFYGGGPQYPQQAYGQGPPPGQYYPPPQQGYGGPPQGYGNYGPGGGYQQQQPMYVQQQSRPSGGGAGATGCLAWYP